MLSGWRRGTTLSSSQNMSHFDQSILSVYGGSINFLIFQNQIIIPFPTFLTNWTRYKLYGKESCILLYVYLIVWIREPPDKTTVKESFSLINLWDRLAMYCAKATATSSSEWNLFCLPFSVAFLPIDEFTFTECRGCKEMPGHASPATKDIYTQYCGRKLGSPGNNTYWSCTFIFNEVMN